MCLYFAPMNNISKSLSVEFHGIIWIFQTEFSLTHEEE